MAGAIRTSPQNAAYEAGWEATFNRSGEDATGDREPRVRDPEGSTEPEAGEAVAPAVYGAIDRSTFPFWQSQLAAPDAGVSGPERERLSASHSYTYDCPVCGWHRSTDTEPCGNATCRTYKPIRGR